jgi:hypothetical protein
MTRFLLLLSLIGAAIYALLIYTHGVLTERRQKRPMLSKLSQIIRSST